MIITEVASVTPNPATDENNVTYCRAWTVPKACSMAFSFQDMATFCATLIRPVLPDLRVRELYPLNEFLISGSLAHYRNLAFSLSGQ